MAVMDERHVPLSPGSPAANADNISNDFEAESCLLNTSDQLVKDRIIKLLNAGFHSSSNSNEAKIAMLLARKLMNKHNISQALLLKERQDQNQTSKAEGDILVGRIVDVHIKYRKSGKPSLFAQWICDLLSPINQNFSVKSFHEVSQGEQCTVSFYGIYTNAQLAAYAFCVATQRISQMAAVFSPETATKARNISTRTCRLSYARGIVRGIANEVDRSMKNQEIDRNQQHLALVLFNHKENIENEL